ncbi:aminopeptidase N [Marinimicrobium sp. ABcell2]|uniref:aminopeptidase N n=1 Tax=Marinimicrobium sp. ABcell2 TaxID=3069751 RepID=UPI0027B365D2|nr:aminopeptidase N [Marinimicrobium sp. ABcell2]MDQ2078007.1 aminopeptidase N [Marinimicrobium sp. ABcell2]
MSARDAQPNAIQLKDYRAPDYLIDRTDLRVDIGDEVTQVSADLALRRNPSADQPVPELALNGSDMHLISVAIDGRPLESHEFRVDEESLVLINPPEEFRLQTLGEIKPQLNKSLEGLYKSRTIYCTQCEAEGFRKITWYLDRPDVMSEFTTTIVADKTRCPLLLSNGNLLEEGDLEHGRHFATWHDPHKKPAYLFALVAGDLQHITDHFTTRSGREVTLKIYVEEKDLDKCGHAMESLKHAMRWDEERYGREYDLDIFMIVAVDDFNMGAMENKGLNIFNTACVLAKPETTTDTGFQRVEAVVAHEYFHNWSGNRVTCRDWFQLSLKEGFTVYRDSMFSADMGSPTVKRVEDVSMLRTAQFAEDAGPMAHPVRPDSYIEISNFYTLTIYEKGSEVVRMLANLLGPELFRKGTDLYFDRHDGQAVTTEDFVAAMEEVSGRDFTQFKRWYSQAGTPLLEVSDSYDAEQDEYHLTIRQSCRPTPECGRKQPFHIPVAMGLLGAAGPLPLLLQGEGGDSSSTHRVLEVTEEEQTFTFEGIHEQPVPALLRDFSAPVKLQYDYSRDNLTQLMSLDSDGFCRWDASQQLARRVIEDFMAAYLSGEDLTQVKVDARLIEAYRTLLNDEHLDKAMVALMLTLPSEAYISEQMEQIEVEAIHHSRQAVRHALALELEAEFRSVYADHDYSVAYEVSAQAIAQRSLANLALEYLMLRQGPGVVALCEQQYHQSSNMTDRLSALTQIVNSPAHAAAERKEDVLNDFYQRWQGESLVVDQWLRVQATCPLPGTMERVRALESHPAFDPLNPNKIRALVAAFSNGNAINFHATSGEGYELLGNHVLRLNAENPQIAARLLTPLTRWRRYPGERSEQMRAQLERILAEPKISKDVYEVASKSLA